MGGMGVNGREGEAGHGRGRPARVAPIHPPPTKSSHTTKVRSQNAQDSLPWERIRKASMLSRPSLVLGSLYAGFSTNLFLKIPYMSMMFGMHAVNKCIFDMVSY